MALAWVRARVRARVKAVLRVRGTTACPSRLGSGRCSSRPVAERHGRGTKVGVVSFLDFVISSTRTMHPHVADVQTRKRNQIDRCASVVELLFSGRCRVCAERQGDEVVRAAPAVLTCTRSARFPHVCRANVALTRHQHVTSLGGRYGGCVHHDNGPLGAAAIDRAEERKVELLKAQGFNAIRTSHNPPSPAFLDACDRLGMLVMDEAFDSWPQGKHADDYHGYFNEWWRRDLAAMVLRDRNHPAVIMWSIGNEIPGANTPLG